MLKQIPAHLKIDILQTRRLGTLPVYTSRHEHLAYNATSGQTRSTPRLSHTILVILLRHRRQVDDEVADAPEEVVLVHVPLRAVAVRDVRVRICAATANRVRMHMVRVNESNLLRRGKSDAGELWLHAWY